MANVPTPPGPRLAETAVSGLGPALARCQGCPASREPATQNNDGRLPPQAQSAPVVIEPEDAPAGLAPMI